MWQVRGKLLLFFNNVEKFTDLFDSFQKVFAMFRSFVGTSTEIISNQTILHQVPQKPVNFSKSKINNRPNLAFW